MTDIRQGYNHMSAASPKSGQALISLRQFITICFLAVMVVSISNSWESKVVHRNGLGSLVYVSDAAGNKIADFSWAGYRCGGVSLPTVPVLKTLSPVSGDNTASIQAALDELAARTPDANGFRGALLLSAGAYVITGTLYVRESGIVLRGAGEGSDPASNTILVGRGDTPHQRTIVVAGGGSQTKWRDKVSGTQKDIVSDTLFVGDRIFEVADASQFAAGDNVIIYHPCTDAWLSSIKYGETSDTIQWGVDEQPIVYNRTITAINGTRITIDAPIMNTLMRSLSQSYIYKYARAGIKTNIGIENLRIDIEATGSTTDTNGDENHAWNAIELTQIEDSWVRHCTMLHFGHSGIQTATATRITIDSCSALDPVSIITGERRYNFNVYTASQLILFRNCAARYGRHDYVSNGTSWTSGCVFLDCISEFTYASSEGHRRWSQGLLYDNIVFKNPKTTGYVFGLYCRGNMGTAHGWASAHSVAWNCNAGSSSIIIQKPPTAQNYAIGCTGNVTGATPPAPFLRSEGYVEGVNTLGLEPRSLYLAQLQDRLSPSRVRNIGLRRVEREDIYLADNYPNPFNPSTSVQFSLSSGGPVSLAIFDLLGREVALLVNERLEPGTYTQQWDASGMPSGIYFFRLAQANRQLTKKMIIAK